MNRIVQTLIPRSFCLLLLAATLFGCKAREMGVPTADHTAEFVDGSWLTATKNCWPELEHDGFTDAGMRHNLADPLRFRSTFPSYAAQSEPSLRSLVTKPLMAAPAPDGTVLMNSRTPVLTRSQAAAGSDSHKAAVQGTNGPAPPDALCSVHAGTPVGWK